MHVSLTDSFTLPPRAVLELMKSEDFQREKADRINTLEFDMHVEDGPAPTVVTQRKLATANLPEFIKPMLNPTMTVTETEQWQEPTTPDGHRTGLFTIDVDGAPVRLVGDVVLEPARNGSQLTFSGELTSSVPLFRNKIEESASGSVVATIKAEFALIHEHAQVWADWTPWQSDHGWTTRTA